MHRFVPKTVVFLGAGASKCAGYPLAGELLPELEREAATTRLVNLQSVWEVWTEFRSKATGLLARFLSNPNPEIALSVIDLMDAALQWEDQAAQQAGFAKAAENMKVGAEMLEQYFEGEARKELRGAAAARSHLLVALDLYFAMKHAALRQSSSSSRDYLRAALAEAGLSAGDAVITTNWDAVAELTLGEDGLWNPFDGYGFLRNLQNGFSGPDGKPLSFPGTMPRTSPVKLLKLHGSFGWYDINDRVCLDYASFLQHLPFKHNSKLFTFRDSLEPPYSGVNPPVFLYPSFLKRIRTPELHEVWHLAGAAVRSAKKLVVIGYSLPEADVAVRTLLMPLRFRAMDGKVQIEVIDRSGATLARWQEFLTGNAEEIRIDLCGVEANPLS